METSDLDEEVESIPLREIMGRPESNEPRLTPCGDGMNTLNLGIKENKKELKVVNNEELEEMIQLLWEFIDIFSWSYDDMPGLDTQIVTHKIPLVPVAMLVKQKLRRMDPNTLLKV